MLVNKAYYNGCADVGTAGFRVEKRRLLQNGLKVKGLRQRVHSRLPPLLKHEMVKRRGLQN